MKENMKGEWFRDYLERKIKIKKLSHIRKDERKRKENERRWK